MSLRRLIIGFYGLRFDVFGMVMVCEVFDLPAEFVVLMFVGEVRDDGGDEIKEDDQGEAVKGVFAGLLVEGRVEEKKVADRVKRSFKGFLAEDGSEWK